MHGKIACQLPFNVKKKKEGELLWSGQVAALGSFIKMYGLCFRAVRQSAGLKVSRLLQHRALGVSVSSAVRHCSIFLSTANASRSHERSLLETTAVPGE